MSSPTTRHLLDSYSILHNPSLRLQASSFIPPRKACGFTLIELLVVIAIIAILAGLGFAGLQGAMESGRKAQARNDVQQIAAAIRAFELEYGRQPDSQTSSDQWISDNSSVVKALIGEDEDLNPKGIRFLEVKNAKGTPPKAGVDPSSKTFYDPWGEPYFLKLNTDYDNVVEYYGENFVAVVVGSKGPNKQQDDPKQSGGDDLLNFK
jgi:prepilin-type N-terminal cleavage/methylation domain-containing protein